MSRTSRPVQSGIIFFDVVETVFSLFPLKAKLTELNLPDGTDRLFFAHLLRDAFALSTTGVFRTFPEIAKGSLTVLLESLGRQATEATLDNILSAFSQLPSHEDVKPALEKVKHSDYRAVLLTNGSRSNTEGLVRDNGLDHLVDDVISVEDFGIWKPQQALYHQAALKHSCDPGSALLVAAHAWDVHGAMAAGFHGVWVQRQDAIYHPLMGKPDGQASNLVEAVDLAIQQLAGGKQ